MNKNTPSYLEINFEFESKISIQIVHYVCILLRLVYVSNSRRIHDNGDGLYMVFYDDNIPWAKWSVYTTRSLHK